MFAEERHRIILEILKEQSRVSVLELTKILGASEATVRRDLHLLENNGNLKRSHGGALLKSVSTYEPLFSEKTVLHKQEKEYIATLAARHINDGDTIILDSGTTTLALALLLKQKQLQIITTSIDIADILGESHAIDVILTGGIIRQTTKALVGDIAVKSLLQFHVHKAFLGINSIEENCGFTTPSIEEATIKKTMIRQASEIFFLADSSKFDTISFANVASLKEGHVIVTDKKLKNSSKNRYEKCGVVIIN
ncbi:MAG: DeoR/GlpR family DNA-binding transcription regulator [Defluviitaleaceae bacterium]|nr:DeoR/GlpR family DNA-binding transcription regulator [Defluviitaleaceae bacterium]